jgi:membrane associated rhomboid family serine protease
MSEETCFYHQDRLTGRACTRCGRPACSECLQTASVGSHCFECVRQQAPDRKEQRRVRSALGAAAPAVTYAIIALDVALWIINRGKPLITFDYGLSEPHVADGEWYRIVTSGFLHDPVSIFHIGFNMYALWIMGPPLERLLGHVRFAGLYMLGLLGGSLGVIILESNALTVGASGAIYGLFGAFAVFQHSRGVDILKSQITYVIGINLLLTFGIRTISIGGHLGGLTFGIIGGLLLFNPKVRAIVPKPDIVLGLLIILVATASIALAQPLS